MTNFTKDLREWAAWMRDDGLADDASMLVIIADRIDDELGESIDKLREQNAKLLELALGLHKCLVNEGCEGCPMQDDNGWCVRDIRLRELGIEVTE